MPAYEKGENQKTPPQFPFLNNQLNTIYLVTFVIHKYSYFDEKNNVTRISYAAGLCVCAG